MRAARPYTVRTPPPEENSIDRRTLLGILFALVFVVVANNSAGSIAQPAIGVAFDAGPGDVGWVVFGFSVSFAVATAVWGGLARILGLGPALAAAIALFAAGSVVAPLAPTLPLLIAARVIQGLGAGAIPTLSAAIIARRYEGAERSRALGTIVAAVGIGLAAGPLIGGAALEAFGWQGPIALGIVAAPAAIAFLREDRDRDRSVPLDVVGAVLVAATVIALTFSLNRLPILGLVPVTVGAAGVAVGGTILVVRRSRLTTAFLPGRIVAHRAFLRVVVLGLVGMSAFFGSLIIVPVAAAAAHGLSGIALGLILLPMALVGALASFNNARVQARFGRPRTTRVSLLSLAVGAGILGAIGAGVPPAITAIALVPLGLGFGLLGPPLLNELTVVFDGADRGIAVGAYNLAFFMGGAMGGAVATALVQVGLEIELFAGRPVPGFSTAEILLAIGPLIAVALLSLRSERSAVVVTAPGGPSEA